MDREQKSLYLTFDDGPIPEVTPWVLKQLEHYRAKATFFVIGDNVQKHPEILNQIHQRGHTIANHTQHHLRGTQTDHEAYLEDVFKCETTLSHTLKTVRLKGLFRPPYGRIKQNQAKSLTQLGYKIVMWDVLSADFDPKVSSQQCLKNVMQSAKSGSVIVFHDSLKAKEKLEYALPRVLAHFSKEGFEFKCIPEPVQ